MARSILVVEDEAHVRELVSHTLQGAGFKVQEAPDGESAVQLFTATKPDLVVLDVRLPGIDGWDVCRTIRSRGNVPILFLSALSDDESVVRGLRLGGDDYLPKPFSPAVLAARVQALLRRADSSTPVSSMTLRGMTIDFGAAEVRRDGTRVLLTATEFRMLATLAQHVGQVVSAREITRSAQGYDLADAEAQELVKVHVRHIRRKIEPVPDHPRYVVTVRGLGYMLNREELEERR